MNSALKWFALVLIFFNLAYLVWAVTSPDSELSSKSTHQLEGESIRLLSELTEQERSILIANAELEAAAMISEPYCPSLGPFDSSAKLKEFGQKLSKNGLSATSRMVTIDTSEKYRVYLPPYASYEAAGTALKKLRANKIDSYIMTEAPLTNAISLGIFSSEESAEGLVKKMNSHGFRAMVAPTVMEKNAYWLDISSPSSSEATEQTLISILANAKGITRIDSPCKVVALVK